MKRVYFVMLILAMLLATGCFEEELVYTEPYSAEIISENDRDSTPMDTPGLAEVGNTEFMPPLTVSGVVESAAVNGELIDLRISIMAAGRQLPLDIRINGNTTAVGDIYAMGESSIVTATVAEWQRDDAGYFGTATNISVDNIE